MPDFLFCSLFPVQQTTSGICHRVIKQFFRVDNQYAECEKQIQQCHTQQSHEVRPQGSPPKSLRFYVILFPIFKAQFARFVAEDAGRW